MAKVSGPLLDRIDIHIELSSVKYNELTETKNAESSEAIKKRVEQSRTLQRERFKNDGVFCNAAMNSKFIRKYCALEKQARELLKEAMQELGLSARAYDKILKISRTVADLKGCGEIKQEHLAEAIQYRSLDIRF